MLHKIIIFFVSFLTLIIHIGAVAQPLSISAKMGATQLNVSKIKLGVTPLETDNLHEDNNIVTPCLSVGLNYSVPLTIPKPSPAWLSQISFGIYLNYLKQEVYGQVFQYQQASINNYLYTLSVRTISVMLDANLTVWTYHDCTSLYVLGGIGNAWNRLGYQDTSKANVEGGALALNNKTTTGFTYELGTGIAYQINCGVSVFLEYLFEDFPNIRLSESGRLNGVATTIPSPAVSYSAQTLSLGFNWRI